MKYLSIAHTSLRVCTEANRNGRPARSTAASRYIFNERGRVCAPSLSQSIYMYISTGGAEHCGFVKTRSPTNPKPGKNAIPSVRFGKARRSLQTSAPHLREGRQKGSHLRRSTRNRGDVKDRRKGGEAIKNSCTCTLHILVAF